MVLAGARARRASARAGRASASAGLAGPVQSPVLFQPYQSHGEKFL